MNEQIKDRELLELAAKAAGAEIEVDPMTGSIEVISEIGGFSGIWNPLADDGDAFRLAVKLAMSVDICDREESTYAYAGDSPRAYAMENWRDSRNDATRRAIVRAAAAIVAKS